MPAAETIVPTVISAPVGPLAAAPNAAQLTDASAVGPPTVVPPITPALSAASPVGVIETIESVGSALTGLISSPLGVATSAPRIAAGPTLNLPTVSGLPVPLPSELSMPHDLVCAGLGWSATQQSGGTQPAAFGQQPDARRDW